MSFKMRIASVRTLPVTALKEESKVSRTGITIDYELDGMERTFDQFPDAFDFMARHGGGCTVWLPLADSNLVVMEVITEERKTGDSPLASLLSGGIGLSLFGGGRGGVDIGSLLASAFASAGTADKYAKALTDDDKVLVIGSGTRDGKDDIEVTVPVYRRLKALDMVDECDACSARLERLVVHPEGDYTIEQVKTFVETEQPNV